MAHESGIIERRLKELDQILQELMKYLTISPDVYRAGLKHPLDYRAWAYCGGFDDL